MFALFFPAAFCGWIALFWKETKCSFFLRTAGAGQTETLHVEIT